MNMLAPNLSGNNIRVQMKSYQLAGLPFAGFQVVPKIGFSSRSWSRSRNIKKISSEMGSYADRRFEMGSYEDR